MSDNEIKQQVRNFYDQIGWKMESDGFYQNARYEDLRPVSKEYIEKCHLRVNGHLIRPGKYLLDAGSGPIQYPAYLTYMEDYQYRMCLDISIVALQEARKRIGDKGLFVVADVSNLPFENNAFDGVVSLHTLHHLDISDQKKAYRDLFRVLKDGHNAVIVNGWTKSNLMVKLKWLLLFMERMKLISQNLFGTREKIKENNKNSENSQKSVSTTKPTGTFIEKMDASSIKSEFQEMNLSVLVWRSVSIRFLRGVFHSSLGGKFWLKILFALEEKFPEYFGSNGQYPLIVIRK